MRYATFIFAALALGFVVGVQRTRAARAPQAATHKAARYQVPRDGAMVRGSADALVTVVEFGDYACVHTAQMEGILRKLLAESPDVRLVWHDDPLFLHPHALLAAKAARAAAAQGRFWEMHDRLIADPSAIDRDRILQLARELGLDLIRFEGALSSRSVEGEIERDADLAAAFGVLGTPVFFVNGRRVQGEQSLAFFRSLVRRELATARAAASGGISAAEAYRAVIRDAIGPTRAPDSVAVQSDADPNNVYRVPVGTSPVAGPADAKVTLILWGNFESADSANALRKADAVMRRHPADVRVVWKNMFGPEHRRAMMEAQAAMAAHAQGRFWPVARAMLAERHALYYDDLIAVARRAGVDVERFRDALDHDRFEKEVEDEIRAGRAVGVHSAPMLFVNGRRIWGGESESSLDKMIRAEIASIASP